jgi:thioredoxin reductase
MGRLGVLAASASSVHFAVLVSEWAAAGQTTFFVNDAIDPDAAQLAELASRAIQVEREPVVGASGDLPGLDLRLRDGRVAHLDGLFLVPKTHFKTPFAEQLGCELEQGGMGAMYKTDATKETTVPGVFACGDVALLMPSVSFAVADGVRAGAAAHQSLVFRPGTPLP